MTIIKLAATAWLGIGLMMSVAQAHTVDQRHYDKQHRVDRGIRNGSLRPGEVRRIEHQQHSIDRQ